MTIRPGRALVWACLAFPLASAARAGGVDYGARMNEIKGLIWQQNQFGKAEDLIGLLLQDPAAPPQTKAEAVLWRGVSFLKQEKRDQALATWRQAEKMAEQITDGRQRMDRLRDTYKRCQEAGSADDVLRIALKVLPQAQQMGDLSARGEACVYLMWAYDAKGQAQESQKLVAQMRAIIEGSKGNRMAPSDIVARLLDVGRTPLALELAEACLQADPLARVSGHLRRMGDEFSRNKDVGSAFRWYNLACWACEAERGGMGCARDCQTKAVDILVGRGALNEACQYARLYFLACDIREVQKGMDLAARVLKGIDKDINVRVRSFLEFQRYGAAGKDGVPGTPDDIKNPLADVKLPEPPPVFALGKMLAATTPFECRTRAFVYLLHGKPEHALMEAIAAYRMATGDNLTDEVYYVATAIKALDGNLLRANQYLLYQKLGRAGQDGKPGTADDIQDPLKGVKLPAPPERDQAFQAEIAKCEDTYDGVRRKGFLLLAWGKSDEGLRAMRDAYARCGMDERALKQAILDVAGAIKAVDGHIVRANQYLLYQKHGPDGPDGIKGTQDDLSDPLASEKKPAPGG